MSYTNETTHYSIPLPLGTDLTTPMDYNESMEALDTAVWGATQDAATATSDAADAKQTAQGAAGDVATLSETVTGLSGTVTEQGQAITGNTNAIGALKTDVYDMISSDSETSATATHQHLVGDLFIYNDTLYVTTVQINVGDTIVPNTNCNTTTIEAQLGADSGLDGRVTTLETKVGSTPLTTTATDLSGGVNELDGHLKASNSTAGVTDVPFRFGCDDSGNFGYILNVGGADTVIPFSSGSAFPAMLVFNSSTTYIVATESGTTAGTSANPYSDTNLRLGYDNTTGWYVTPLVDFAGKIGDSTGWTDHNFVANTSVNIYGKILWIDSF